MDFIHKIDNLVPSDLCKSIIEKFKVDHAKHQGKVGPGIVKLNIKNSTDLHIGNREDWKELVDPLVKILAEGLQQYFIHIENHILVTKNLEIFSKIFGNNIQTTGFQVQCYETGGVFNWHTDDSYQSKRLLAFIMYLNTVDSQNGGSTEFLNNKHIYPTEGSILFFPATWSYIHRGNVLKSGEKYIISGFIEQSNLKNCNE